MIHNALHQSELEEQQTLEYLNEQNKAASKDKNQNNYQRKETHGMDGSSVYELNFQKLNDYETEP